MQLFRLISGYKPWLQTSLNGYKIHYYVGFMCQRLEIRSASDKTNFFLFKTTVLLTTEWYPIGGPFAVFITEPSRRSEEFEPSLTSVCGHGAFR